MSAPLTIAALREIPGARALRYSVDWFAGGRLAAWVEPGPGDSWSVVLRIPGAAAIPPNVQRDRDAAVRALNRGIGPRRVLARQPSLTIDEWEIAP